MKGNSLSIILIIIGVIGTLIFLSLFFIAYTGHRAAVREEERIECQNSQFLLTYSLFKYKSLYNKFPESLDELVEKKFIKEVPLCPTTHKKYQYYTRKDGKDFVLYCEYNPDYRRGHNPYLSSKSKEVISGEVCKEIGYSYLFKKLYKDSNILYIKVFTRTFSIVFKNKDHRFTEKYKSKIKELNKYLKEHKIDREVELYRY